MPQSGGAIGRPLETDPHQRRPIVPFISWLKADVVPTCYQSDSPCHPKIGPAAVTKRPQRRDGRAEVGVANAAPAVKPAKRDDDVAMDRGSPTATASPRQHIGSATGRERVCTDELITVVAL